MKGFAGATPSRGKSQRMGDVAETIEWPKNGEYLDVRMLGPVYSIANFWFTIATQQRPAPKGVAIPKMCLDHDGESDKYVSDVCPYRKSGLGRESKEYWVNVIVRDLQNDERGRPKRFPTKHDFPAERHLGHKAYWGKKGDARKTPVRLLRIPDSQVAKLVSLGKLNKKRTSEGVETYELSDPAYGCDIAILESNDPKAKGAAKFDIQKKDRTPLTEEERRYIIFRPDLLKPERLEQAKAEMENLRGKIIERSGDKDSSKSRTRSESREDADDELIDVDDEDLRGSRRGKSRSDDDEPAPRKRRRDDEDVVDLEDDEPTPRKRRRDDDDDEPAPRKRRRDDEDEDDDEKPAPRKRRHVDEDDDDEPAPRKRRRDDDEDDDDEPAPRKRRRDDDEDDIPF